MTVSTVQWIIDLDTSINRRFQLHSTLIIVFMTCFKRNVKWSKFRVSLFVLMLLPAAATHTQSSASNLSTYSDLTTLIGKEVLHSCLNLETWYSYYGDHVAAPGSRCRGRGAAQVAAARTGHAIFHASRRGWVCARRTEEQLFWKWPLIQAATVQLSGTMTEDDGFCCRGGIRQTPRREEGV